MFVGRRTGVAVLQDQLQISLAQHGDHNLGLSTCSEECVVCGPCTNMCVGGCNPCPGVDLRVLYRPCGLSVRVPAVNILDTDPRHLIV